MSSLGAPDSFWWWVIPELLTQCLMLQQSSILEVFAYKQFFFTLYRVILIAPNIKLKNGLGNLSRPFFHEDLI